MVPRSYLGLLLGLLAAARLAYSQSILSPGLTAEQAAQLVGYWQYADRPQGVYNFFGGIWDEMMAGAAVKGEPIDFTAILTDALKAGTFKMDGGILIPAVEPSSGVFAGYFVVNGITPPPPDPPEYPVVARLVAKARPGKEPQLLTWQGFYSNTSSLLEGVVQEGPGGELQMDFLSLGGVAIKKGLPVDNQHACEYFLIKSPEVDIEEMVVSLAPKLPVSLDGGV